MFQFSLWYPIVPSFAYWDIFWNTLRIIQSSICMFWMCLCELCYGCNWCDSKLETVCHYRRFSDFPSVIPRECCNLTFVHSPLTFQFTFYHLYLFGLFQLWPHTYTTQWFGNFVLLEHCVVLCVVTMEKVLMNISYNTYVKPLSGIYMTFLFTSLVFLTFHCTICIS